MILLLEEDAPQALGNRKFVQFLRLAHPAPILANRFLLIIKIVLGDLAFGEMN